MSIFAPGNPLGDLSRYSCFILILSNSRFGEKQKPVLTQPVNRPDEEELLVDSIFEALQFGLSLPRAMKIMQAVDTCSDVEVIERGEQTLLRLSDQNECKFLWRHMQRCFSLLPTRWVHTGGPI